MRDGPPEVVSVLHVARNGQREGGERRSASSTPRGAGAGRRGRGALVRGAPCHNRDPGKDGPIGPAVKGSSEALVEARLLRGGYPPGYTPKRDSKVMPARPALARGVADPAAFPRVLS